MPRQQIVLPKHPGYLLPDGWSDTWLTAKAAAGSAQANIALLGDSIIMGGGTSDLMNKNIAAKLKTGLAGTWSSDFWGYAASSKTGFGTGAGSGGTPANAPIQDQLNGYVSSNSTAAYLVDGGWTRTYLYDGTAANPAGTFTTPYACTDIDMFYLAYPGGTWEYRIDGTALKTITDGGNGTSTGACVRKISFTGLANTTHTIDFGWQSANKVMAIMGFSTFANGRNAAGYGMARFCHGYGSALLYATSTLPADRLVLFTGLTPQTNSPLSGTPGTLTVAPQTVAGNVTAGTRYWGYTWVGPMGEWPNPPAGSPGAITNTGAQGQVALSGIAVGPTGTTRRRLYRTVAGGFTFELLYEIPDNTTTTYTDNIADGSLGVTAPLDIWQPAYAATGFGYPLNASLAIIAMGVNDCNLANSQTTYAAYLQRQIQALRRATPGCSILLIADYYPYIGGGTFYESYTDMLSSTFAHGDTWVQFKSIMAEVAQAYSCGFIDLEHRWGSTPVAGGFLPSSDIHPLDAGHADMATAILAVI